MKHSNDHPLPQQRKRNFSLAHYAVFAFDGVILLVTLYTGDWIWCLILLGAALWSYRIWLKEVKNSSTRPD
jgi:hypothetical protein